MNNHYLLDTESVKTYLTGQLGIFSSQEHLAAEEIGDGNINYVFRVRSEMNGKSIIVKQADRLLRSSGRPLDITRSKREAEALRIYAALTPQFIPQLYRYDETMSTICMEDISACGSLRKELMAGHPLPDRFAENAAAFLADAVFPTSDLFVPPEEKKERVKDFINPELCAISETLVFSEPYCNGKNRNRITAGNESFVQKMLYTDEALKAEVAALRETFMNKAEALIHGDLHTGSVFIGRAGINENSMKIIDPEFAFYGPLGYDLGNLIANLYFAWMYTAFIGNAAYSGGEVRPADNRTEQSAAAASGAWHSPATGTQAISSDISDAESTDAGMSPKADVPTESSDAGSNAERIAAAIEVMPELFTVKALKRCRNTPLSDPIYNERYIRQRLADIVADAFGFAGTEIIRRTVGDTKTAEFDAMGTDTRRIPAERLLIKTARMLIKRRRQHGIGKRAAAYFKRGCRSACSLAAISGRIGMA